MLFTVKWGTDEEGRLVAVDTQEVRRVKQRLVRVVCPEGAGSGDRITIDSDGRMFEVVVPESIGPGNEFEAAVAETDSEPDPDSRVVAIPNGEGHQGLTMTTRDVKMRVKGLQTSLSVQARLE